MAKKILIPIDFSPYSNKAIEYACPLALKQGLEVVLIHVFTDHTNIYQNAQENPELIDPRVGEVKRDLQQIVASIKNEFPELHISTLLKDGNLYDEVKKIVSAENYEAIIMGTKGANGLEALLIGSNTFDVFLNTSTPVLAVPNSDKKLKTEKIGLLCNFKQGEIDVLKQAIQLYGKDFELVLIHVNTTNETISVLDQKFATFIQSIIAETGIEDISYVIKAQLFLAQYKEDISSAINSVVADELLDALLVTKSKKGFLRKVIEENIVKKMAFQTQIPKFFAKVTQE